MLSRQVIYRRAIFTFSPFITPSFSLGKGHVWDNVYTSACNPWMCKMCELRSLFRTAAAEKCGVLRFGRVGWEVRSNTNKAWLWSWRLWKQEKGRGTSREVKAERVIASARKQIHFNHVCFFDWRHSSVMQSLIFFKSFFLCPTHYNWWTDKMHDNQGKSLCWLHWKIRIADTKLYC